MSEKVDPNALVVSNHKKKSLADRAANYFLPATRKSNSVKKQKSSPGTIKVTPEGLLMKAPKATIKVGADTYKNVDPREIIRAVKYITQSIGEYKRQDNLQSSYIVPALRKSRAQMVADLEQHFKISWQVNPDTGQSEFVPLQ